MLGEAWWAQSPLSPGVGTPSTFAVEPAEIAGLLPPLHPVRLRHSDLCTVSQLLRLLTMKQDIPADLPIKGSFRGEGWRIHLLPAFRPRRRAIKRLARCVLLALDLVTVARTSMGSRFTSKPDSWG